MLRRIIVTACLLFIATSALGASKSSYQLIQRAYKDGLLTNEQKLLLEVRSVKNPSSLPLAYQSTVIEIAKCATDILLEAKSNFNDLSAAGQTEMRNILARPSATNVFDSPGGKFKIHYNISGPNAVPLTDSDADGIPDYIEWLAGYADSSYRSEVLGLGQFEPPSDGVAGGDSRYDIYTEEMGYYGYTQSEGGGPNPWNDAYSYISVHRNFLGFPPNNDPEGNQKGAAKVTVAHEYYHAVQFAYNYMEEAWLMEASSTWMEDFVYPQVNDNYNYLSSWFGYPDYALNSTTNLHQYAAFIWPKYLSQNFGSAIMPELWNQCIYSNAYPALTTVLANHGRALNSEFAEFCSWNFITGSRNDHEHFLDGSYYPLISTVRTHTTYPVTGQGPLTGKAPDAMGANYVIFTLPGGTGNFTVDFNGDNSTPWIVNILGWKSSGGTNIYQEFQMTLNGSGDGSYTVVNPQDYTYIVMVISNTSQSLNDRGYVYGASFVSAPQYAVVVNAVADDSLYSHTKTHLIYNVHNTGSNAETFTLAAADRRGWSILPSRNQITLTSGATDTVSVSVPAPAMTNEGVKDTVMLTATSTSATGVSDTDSATALVFVQNGDADNSGSLDISDAVYLIGYIFNSGADPMPVMDAGDANCDGAVDISDVVFLIAYIFNSGPPPPCNPF